MEMFDAKTDDEERRAVCLAVADGKSIADVAGALGIVENEWDSWVESRSEEVTTIRDLKVGDVVTETAEAKHTMWVVRDRFRRPAGEDEYRVVLSLKGRERRLNRDEAEALLPVRALRIDSED